MTATESERHFLMFSIKSHVGLEFSQDQLLGLSFTFSFCKNKHFGWFHVLSGRYRATLPSLLLRLLVTSSTTCRPGTRVLFILAPVFKLLSLLPPDYVFSAHIRDALDQQLGGRQTSVRPQAHASPQPRNHVVSETPVCHLWRSLFWYVDAVGRAP